MAVQQNKVSPSRRNKRRAHDALSSTNWVECPACGELKLPHHVCPACGQYNGRVVVQQVEEDLDDAE